MANAKKFIEENLRTQNPRLDLGNCGLDGSEPELAQLAECTHLETLIFSNGWEEYDEEKQKWVYKESRNQGPQNQLQKIPPHLPPTPRQLILAGTRDMFNRWQIEDISALQALSQLQSLDLSKNKIQNYSFLQALTQLQSLNLSWNQIQDISFLQHLSQLKYLNLMANRIRDIYSLQPLSQLQELILSKNQIQDISFLQNLSNLHTLGLSDNQIQDISFLQPLSQLKSLDLGENRIQDISLDFLNHFPQLNELELYANPIQNIPPEIFDKFLKNVLQAVRDYLQDLEKGRVKNREVKVILIGNGGVGKTQIAKRLAEPDTFIFNTEHASTHAIARLRRDLADFQLTFWDFAGQDLYHATHRLFMQTRALFLLVWDFASETQPFHTWQGKNYENEKLRYWLEYTRCFAPESPILVLQNKMDAFPQDLYFEYKEGLKEEYPVLDFLALSAKTGKGFRVLEKVLKKTLQNNPAFQSPDLPADWVQVREAIRDLQEKDVKTLRLAEFKDICVANEVEKSAATILNYLHDTGVLYYRRGYFQNQIILNQDWAIQAIYKILDRESEYFEELQYEKGNLDYDLLTEIWEDNTDYERELFVDFMLSAELAFESTESKKLYPPLRERSFVVPQLLPTEKPSDVLYWEKKNATQLQKAEIPYRFLPKVFIQRFIVKANRFSEVRLMWQRGLLLRTKQGEAMVEAFYEREKQAIRIIATTDFLIQQIQEELAGIADEGRLRSQAGPSLKAEDKFGLNALTIMNPRNQRRVSRLEKNLQETEALLDEWQEKLRVAENPNERKRCQIEIERLEKMLDDYEAELAELGGEGETKPKPKPKTEPSPSASLVRPLIFLAFANEREAYLDHLKAEEDQLEKIFRPLDTRDQIKLLIKGQTSLDNLYDTLTEYREQVSLLHYGGHANQSSLQLDSEAASAQGLARLIGSLPHLQLVFLNGCATLGQVTDLLHRGVKSVMATSAPVEDGKASAFAGRFYTSLVRGESLRQAFNDAVSYLEAKSQLEIGEVQIRYMKSIQAQKTSSQEKLWGLYTREEANLDWRLVD